MKIRRNSQKHDLVIDLGLSSLKLRHRGRGLELPLRRRPDGRILPDCREELCEKVREFLRTERLLKIGPSFKTPKARCRAVCGIPSRGVSLRSLELPAASRDETERLLSFQIEREFPLPPDELAFGHHRFEMNGGEPSNNTTQEILLAALRREALDEYATLFAECGLNVSFVLGSLAASRICSLGSGHTCVLDIGRTHSELVDVVDGRPRTVRCLSWGGESVTVAIAESLGIHRDRAEEMKLDLTTDVAHRDPWGSVDATRSAQAVEKAVEALARQLEECWRSGAAENGNRAPSELILLGGGSRLARISELIERGLGGSTRCRRVEVAPGPAVSAVTVGLEQKAQARSGDAVLRLGTPRRTSREKPKDRPLALVGWLITTGLLALASVGLRFAPPLFGESDLDTRIREREVQLAAQPEIDRELSFLTMVRSSYTPYLEVLAAVANSAPPGCFISELSMNRRGEASLRGRIGNAEQVEELRKKLGLSGWFERVVVQERTPQKKYLDFHLLAQFRPECAARPQASEPPPSSPSPKPPSPASPAAGSPPAGPPCDPSPSGSAKNRAGSATADAARTTTPETTAEGNTPPGEGSEGKSPSKPGEPLRPQATSTTGKPEQATTSPAHPERKETSATTAKKSEGETKTGDGASPAPEKTEAASSASKRP